MTLEIKKRIFTSIILLILFVLMYSYLYILIISLIIIAIISWIEFYGLILKIFKKNKILQLLFKSFCLMYLSILVFGILYIVSNKPELQIFFAYSILVSIASDIGGLIFGKLFKGKKLTKISPKKTISGSIGSYVFSNLLVRFFSNLIINHEVYSLIVIALIIS